jgi:alpha-tubulin suppressor-like RCC1 family protein
VGNALLGRAVGWTSSDTTVATVLSTGLVTTVGPGTVKITATAIGTTALPSASTTLTVAAVSRSLSFVSLNPGYQHSCGLATDGFVYCWGDNARGQLGNAATSTTTPFRIADTLSLSFASLSAGYQHSCAVTVAGAAYCWGGDNYGELGSGTAAASLTAVAVAGGQSYQRVAAGYFHSCGLTAGGAAYCWGANGYGALGDSTSVTRSTPVAVRGGLVFSAVGTGFYHSCGLVAGGAAYCWGSNDHGQLGNDTTSNSSTPVRVAAGGISFTSLAVGSYHACGLTADGTAYCWGDNGNGQLGNGATTDVRHPVAVSGGLRFASLSAGASYTCGVTTAGDAWCWGYNGYGQLGNGTTAGETSLPTAVPGGLRFRSVVAGAYHTCGLAVNGTGYCWGNNVTGQLGDGTRTSSVRPVKVSGQP